MSKERMSKTRREKIELRLKEAKGLGIEYPFGSGVGFRDVVPELRALWAVLDAARKVEASGILCDPGCCGDDCGCEDLRLAIGRTA